MIFDLTRLRWRDLCDLFEEAELTLDNSSEPVAAFVGTEKDADKGYVNLYRVYYIDVEGARSSRTYRVFIGPNGRLTIGEYF